MWRTEPILPAPVRYRRFPGVALSLVSETFSEHADVDDSIVWNTGVAGRFPRQSNRGAKMEWYPNV